MRKILTIPQDRLKLYQFLLALPAPQFELVIVELQPPQGNLSPAHAPQSQRVSELFNWLESPIGPGIAALTESLEKILNP